MAHLFEDNLLLTPNLELLFSVNSLYCDRKLNLNRDNNFRLNLGTDLMPHSEFISGEAVLHRPGPLQADLPHKADAAAHMCGVDKGQQVRITSRADRKS